LTVVSTQRRPRFRSGAVASPAEQNETKVRALPEAVRTDFNHRRRNPKREEVRALAKGGILNRAKPTRPSEEDRFNRAAAVEATLTDDFDLVGAAGCAARPTYRTSSGRFEWTIQSPSIWKNRFPGSNSMWCDPEWATLAPLKKSDRGGDGNRAQEEAAAEAIPAISRSLDPRSKVIILRGEMSEGMSRSTKRSAPRNSTEAGTQSNWIEMRRPKTKSSRRRIWQGASNRITSSESSSGNESFFKVVAETGTVWHLNRGKSLRRVRGHGGDRCVLKNLTTNCSSSSTGKGSPFSGSWPVTPFAFSFCLISA
jgi:hypothetical protein